MNEKVNVLVEQIVNAYTKHRLPHVFTVGISGIDASGKGYIAELVQQELEARGYKIANINIDPWQNPIPIRLKKENAAENFYNTVFRWQDFFDQLIHPLRTNRNIHLDALLIRTDADEYYPSTYRYGDIDIILIEGIFLFQQRFFSWYDCKVWIDCSFEAGLQRAISRNIEKLDEEALIQDYTTYYYPAQRLHFEKDHPQEAADIIFDNR